MAKILYNQDSCFLVVKAQLKLVQTKIEKLVGLASQKIPAVSRFRHCEIQSM